MWSETVSSNYKRERIFRILFLIIIVLILVRIGIVYRIQDALMQITATTITAATAATKVAQIWSKHRIGGQKWMQWTWSCRCVSWSNRWFVCRRRCRRCRCRWWNCPCRRVRRRALLVGERFQRVKLGHRIDELNESATTLGAWERLNVDSRLSIAAVTKSERKI